MQARHSESQGLYPAALRLVHTPVRGGQGRPKARGRGRGTSSKHIQLNQDLIAAAKSSDGEQLCALVNAQWQDFNAVNAATAYQKLLLMRIARDTRWQQRAGHVYHSARDKVLAVLEPALCEQHVPAFGARECANTLHTLAKTRHRPPSADLLRALEARALEVLGTFNPQDIANTLWSFATLGLKPSEELMARIMTRAVAVQRDFNPQGIANTLWAFATLGLQPSKELMAVMMRQAVAVQGDFEAQNVANLFWAFATLGLHPSEELRTGMMKQAVAVQGDFKEQNIANTLWGFATLGLQPSEELMAGMMKQTVAVQGDFKAQGIAITLWAFATLVRQPSEELMAGMMKQAVAVRGDFKAQEIANTLWAFATLGLHPSNVLLSELTTQAVAVWGDFKPQEIANILWAFATLGLQPSEELMAGMMKQAVAVQGDFQAQGIANMLWAFATLGLQPCKELTAGIMEQAVAMQGNFQAQNIANTLWAFATLGLQPSEGLMAGLTEQALAVGNTFNNQELANTLWAFATLGLQPSEVLLVGLTARAVEVQGDSNPQSIANTLWAACFFSIHSPDVASRLTHALQPQIAALAALASLDLQHQSQLHQFFVACEVDEAMRAGIPASILALKDTMGPACRAAFEWQATQASASQQQVSKVLCRMRLSVEEEARCPRSGYSLDMLVHHTSVMGQTDAGSTVGHGGGWTVEFDGPSHFLACGAPKGATLIKRHHLRLLGHALVSIPYLEWDSVGNGADDQVKYLLGKLQLATPRASTSLPPLQQGEGEGRPLDGHQVGMMTHYLSIRRESSPM